MEKRLSQAVGRMRRELGFHSVQSDRRQLLNGLPANPPSSTNQIARCSFEESHPPFFGRNPTPLYVSYQPGSVRALRHDFVRSTRTLVT